MAEERDIPTKDILNPMLNSKGESLNSKFKMSYSILFNALSSQIIELEEIMKKSFGENANYVALKEVKSKRELIKEKLEKNKIICDFVDIEETKTKPAPVYDFKKNADEVFELAQDFYSRLNIAKSITFPKFMQVIDDSYNYHIALIYEFEKPQGKGSYVSYYRGYIFLRNPNDKIIQTPILLNGVEHRPMHINTKGKPTHTKYLVEVPPSNITAIFANSTNLPKNCPDSEIIEETEVFWKFHKEKKVKHLEIKLYDSDIRATYAKIESMRDQIENSLCYQCEKRSAHIETTSDLNRLGYYTVDLA